MTTRITIRKPDDWHLHVRDGAMLKAVLPFTAKHFGRAILMPNLVPPVVTTKDAIAYRERITAALPAGSTFKPLMTCYLTFRNPTGMIAIIEGLEAWCAKRGFKRVADLTGAMIDEAPMETFAAAAAPIG